MDLVQLSLDASGVVLPLFVTYASSHIVAKGFLPEVIRFEQMSETIAGVVVRMLLDEVGFLVPPVGCFDCSSLNKLPRRYWKVPICLGLITCKKV